VALRKNPLTGAFDFDGGTGGGGGGAPVDASYLVVSPDATLTDERVVSATTPIVFTPGAGSAVFSHAAIGPGGTHGSATQVPQFTLTAQGHISAVTPITISGVTPASHVLATNVALGAEHTISGAAAGQVLRASSATAANFQALPIGDTTGTLAATRGGTAQSTYVTGDLLFASATNTLSKRAIGASGTALRVSGGVPVWATPGALTKTDDTNVTLTLGGSPTTALLDATSLTLGWSGQLAVGRGGTGLSTLASGLIPFGAGTSPFASDSEVFVGGSAGARTIQTGTSSGLFARIVDGGATAGFEMGAGGSTVLTLTADASTANFVWSGSGDLSILGTADIILAGGGNVSITAPAIGASDWASANHTHASAATGGTLSYANLTSRAHVLATTSGLGADHTVSGLTAGQVLRATGATTAAFGSIAETDIPVLTSAQWRGRCSDETGTGLWVFNDAPTFATRITTPEVLGSTNLNVRSTSGGGGEIRLDDFVTLFDSMGNQSSGTQDVLLFDASFDLTGGTRNILRIAPTIANQTGGALIGMDFNPTSTFGSNSSFKAVYGRGTYTSTAASVFGTWILFDAQPTLVSTTNGTSPYPAVIFANRTTVSYGGTTAATHGTANSFSDGATFTNSSTGTLTLATPFASFDSVPTFNSANASGTLVVPAWYFANCRSHGATATGTLTRTEFAFANVAHQAGFTNSYFARFPGGTNGCLTAASGTGTVTSGTNKGPSGGTNVTIQGWINVNINGTQRFVPFYG